jgi:PAS domain S-box-containing protein
VDSKRLVRVGALLFAMFGVGLAAVMSRDASALASEMWPAVLGAVAVYTVKRRQVPLILFLVLVLAFAAFWLGGRPLGLSVGGAIGVMLEAAVIAWVMTAGGRIRPALRTDDDVSRYVVAVTLGGLVAAFSSMVALGLTGEGALWLIGLGTFVGHASSSLILLPFFVDTDDHPAIANKYERVCQWVVTLGVTAVVFIPGDFPAMLFLVIPGLGWGALRGPLKEVQLQLLAVVTIGTVLTTWGYGPLAEAPDRYALPEDVTGIVLQSFFIACVLVTIPLSMAVGQQVENARQARVERDRVQQIVSSANVAIIGTDEIGRVTLFNPGAEVLLGYTPDDVLGRFTTMFHTPEEISRQAELLGVRDDFVSVSLKLAEPGTGAVDIKFLRKDAVERTHLMTLSRIVDDRDAVIGYVSTSEDVDDRVRAHEAIVDALDAERRAVDRLREVDQVKDTFVSAVSHELRTPITSIVGYLEMLQDGSFGELNAEQDDAIGRVNTNSRRLLSLIDELLTLSRVQDEGLGLDDREDIDLAAVVQTAYDVVAPSWSARDLAVHLLLPEGAVPFTGDEEMLERMVVNLLGNAVKFTPEGGRVSVELHHNGAGAVIEVADTGIGIPLEEQELLFTRFFRSSTAQAQAIPGSGLGLSIAHAIVEMHGGDVGVTSQPGIGTTFRVRLPAGS